MGYLNMKHLQGRINRKLLACSKYVFLAESYAKFEYIAKFYLNKPFLWNRFYETSINITITITLTSPKTEQIINDAYQVYTAFKKGKPSLVVLRCISAFMRRRINIICNIS